MDKLVRKIEIPLAKKIIEKAGLYIVQKKEVQNARENDNKNRCVTTIRKET